MCIDLIFVRRAIDFKQLIFVEKSKGHKQKDFQTGDMEKDITVLNVTMFCI